jgi:hypothetical protein
MVLKVFEGYTNQKITKDIMMESDSEKILIYGYAGRLHITLQKTYADASFIFDLIALLAILKSDNSKEFIERSFSSSIILFLKKLDVFKFEKILIAIQKKYVDLNKAKSLK